MKKNLFKLIFTAILTFNLTASAEMTLNSATRNNPPHYTITNEKMSGVDYELAEVIFNKAGIKINYETDKPSDWATILKQIRTGKKDFIGQATDTKQREKWALFSKTYRLDSNVVVTKAGKDKPFANSEEFINFIKSEKNLKIGVVNGYIYNADALNKLVNFPGKTSLLKRQTTQNLIKLLNKDKVDYIVINMLSANYLLAQQGELDQYSIIDIKATKPIHFMFSKKTVKQEDVNKVSAAIDSSAEEIAAIMKKYYD